MRGMSDPKAHLTVLDLDGKPVTLGSLYADSAVVLVFLRHFG
jgi:hypothetical protein